MIRSGVYLHAARNFLSKTLCRADFFIVLLPLRAALKLRLNPFEKNNLLIVLLPFLAKPLHKKFVEAGKKEKKETEENGEKPKKKNDISGFMDLVSPAVFIGLIGAFVARAIAGSGKADIFGDGAGVVSVITLVTAIVVSLAFELIAKKLKLTWLEPFVMPIGMIVAMVVSVVAFNLLPPEIAVWEWRG